MARKQVQRDVEANKLVIPYGHPAGERAYEIMQRIAERLWEQAQGETAAFVEGKFRNAKTIREWVENEDYFREIKVGRSVYIISYGFRTKLVTVKTEEELRKCS